MVAHTQLAICPHNVGNGLWAPALQVLRYVLRRLLHQTHVLHPCQHSRCEIKHHFNVNIEITTYSM